MTFGAGGCYLRTPAAAAEVPGFAVRAVDTTGAGDGFVAGVLSCLLEESILDATDAATLTRLGRFANAVGALTCLTRGAIPALPARDAVALLLRHGG